MMNFPTHKEVIDDTGSYHLRREVHQIRRKPLAEFYITVIADLKRSLGDGIKDAKDNYSPS